MKKTTTLILLVFTTIFNGFSQNWQPLSSGVDNPVTALCEYEQGYLLAGGHFSNAGGIPSQRFAEWSNSTWLGFNPGADYPLHAIYKDVTDGNIYFGGEFLNIGGVAANRIAAYNGTNWSALGNGLPASVNSIKRYNGDLYAGTVAGLYKWNGTIWQELNFTSSNYIIINDMEVYQNELYVAGAFDQVDGITVNCIAKFNGTSWSAVGQGLDQDGMIDALEVHQNELILSGMFESFNGVICGSLAKWNGTSGSAMGSGVPSVSIGIPNRISALESVNGNLFLGGYFSTINGVPANCVAKFDGSVYTAMDAGVNNQVLDMVEFEGDLIIGGIFTASGSTSLNYIAKWDGVSGLSEGEIDWALYPNPASSFIHVNFPQATTGRMEVVDGQGRVVYSEVLTNCEEMDVDVSNWPQGVYIVQVRSENTSQTQRIIKY